MTCERNTGPILKTTYILYQRLEVLLFNAYDMWLIGQAKVPSLGMRRRIGLPVVEMRYYVLLFYTV